MVQSYKPKRKSCDLVDQKIVQYRLYHYLYRTLTRDNVLKRFYIVYLFQSEE